MLFSLQATLTRSRDLIYEKPEKFRNYFQNFLWKINDFVIANKPASQTISTVVGMFCFIYLFSA